MGYTNYWTQPTDFTKDEWSSVMNEAKYIKSSLSQCNVGVFKMRLLLMEQQLIKLVKLLYCLKMP